MAVLNALLLAAHLLGLVLIMGATLVLWRGADLLARGEGTGPGLPALGKAIYGLGTLGLALSWISGPILLFTEYGGLGAIVTLGPWFWLKLVLVIAVSGLLGASGASFKRAISTKPTAAARAAGLGGIAVICAVALVVAAALAVG